ncbi:hypothetical protein [Streptomyces sp. NPDC051662]
MKKIIAMSAAGLTTATPLSGAAHDLCRDQPHNKCPAWMNR